MRKVARAEVKNRQEYEAIRDEFRKKVMDQKASRRIHVGQHLTFLFENHDTVLYQIQEMIRAEGLEGEREILHEIETYNELLGEKGELGCTLLIEIDDAEKRAELLARWKDLGTTIGLTTADGKRIAPRFDERQVGDSRISSVQYLKFRLGDQIPHKIGCSQPDIDTDVMLTPLQLAALCSDLMSS